MKKITLKRARKLHRMYYFTGRPCPKGHIARRHVINRSCTECNTMTKAVDYSYPGDVPVDDKEDYSLNTTLRNTKNQHYPRVKLPKIVLNSTTADYRYVSYKYAKEFVNSLGLNTSRTYMKWWYSYSPAGFPCHPERVYVEWDGWNNFLGNDNVPYARLPSVVKKEDLIEFWEACNIIQSKGYENIEAYKTAFDAGEIQKGIPRHPHYYYNEFAAYGGWKNFLGKEAKYIQETAKNTKPLLVLYQGSERAPNILSIIIHKGGITSLMALIRERNLNVVKIFHWYPDFAEEIFNLLNNYGNKKSDTSWLFANTNEILYELSTVLEIFNPKS